MIALATTQKPCDPYNPCNGAVCGYHSPGCGLRPQYCACAAGAVCTNGTCRTGLVARIEHRLGMADSGGGTMVAAVGIPLAGLLGLGVWLLWRRVRRP